MDQVTSSALISIGERAHLPRPGRSTAAEFRTFFRILKDVTLIAAHDVAVSEVIVFEIDRHYRVASLAEAEREFEWLDVESGVLDGFYTSLGEILVPSRAPDGVYIHLSRSGRLAMEELAGRLASSRAEQRSA